MDGVTDTLTPVLALVTGAALASALTLLGWTRTQRALRAVRGVNTGLHADLARLEDEVGRHQEETARLTRRAEATEDVSSSRLTALLDNANALISLKDPFGRYRFVNRAFADAVGMAADDIIGTVDGHHWPDVASELRGHDHQVLVRRRATEFEEHLPLRDGLHTFLTVRFPLFDPDGIPTGLGAVATDVTELTRVLGSVAGRERVLSTVIAASPDAISILEDDGTVRTTSVAFERIFGHPTREIVDRRLEELVHPGDLAATRVAFERLGRDDDHRTTMRFRAHTSDGRWVTIESHAQLIVGDDGEHDGVVMVSRDVSDQIALELALRQARDDAEHASRAKSELLSRVSHELRTPLNAMLGFAQLLELEELGNQATECVDQIIRAGEHLLALINDVLDIARIESDHMDLRIEPLDAVAAMREVMTLTEPLASHADVALGDGADLGTGTAHPWTPDRPLEVFADRQRLLQVLLNLVSNAIKYNRRSGRVDLHVEAGSEGRARLCVTDSGRGLDRDQIARLFVPFDRLGFEHSPIEGTGVGLALSRGLAERMGGALGVRSTPERGSTFWIELPVAAGDGRTDGPVPTDHLPVCSALADGETTPSRPALAPASTGDHR